MRKPLRLITTKDGLPQSFVSGMVQDKDGFVWIGTRNGLARYDGRHFKVFRHKNGDSATLHSSVITRLMLDKRNRLWIQYDESYSVDCFDPVTEKVEHITERSLFKANRTSFPQGGWMPAADGNFWSLQHTSSVTLYNWSQQKVSLFRASTGYLLGDTVSGLLEDRKNRMWVMDRRGFNRYEPATGRFRHFSFPFRILGTEVTNFCERRNGEIMFNDRRKLVFFDPATSLFRTVAFGDGSNSVMNIQTGPDGYEYFQYKNLIYRYNDAQGAVPVINVNDLSQHPLQTFLVDRSGLIWLGLNTAGISLVDLNAPAFEVHRTVRAFHHDLLKQEFGFALDSFCQTTPPVDFTGSSYQFRADYDARNRLFIALSDRITYFDPAQRKWIASLPRLPEPPKKWADQHPQQRQSIDFAPDGRLWAVNDNNFIGYYDSSAGQWVSFLDTASLHRIESINELLDVEVDNGKVWITTDKGFLSIDLATRALVHFTRSTHPQMLPTDKLLGMEPDPTRPDLLWIGSFEGLICLHKKTLHTDVFTTLQGLPDNTIYSIQTDRQGFLWLSTNQGLCRFHPITHEERNFKAEDGLPGNEFNRFHHMKLPDGRLAFGGMDGWVLFDPNTLRPDTYHPQVAFTGLKIYNEPVIYSPSNKLLPYPLNYSKELRLPYDQNTLTFDFAGLQYNQPGELHYRYRLGNFDDKWITTDNPVASYTRLPPGYYTLQINCTNTVGQWSPQVRTLSVVILPPWWQTGWAYALYVLALAATAGALYRNWLQREKARQQIILQQKEAEQLKAVDAMKNRFFDNITHEFRTPLSLIIAPLEQLQQSDVPPAGWKSSLGMIQQSARQLLRLINQLLDMSKLEAGNMKLALSSGNPQQFVQDIAESFYAAATPKNIAINFDADKPVLADYLFDADKLHTILSNLLSNAVKFTPRGGRVTVTLVHESEQGSSTTFGFEVHDSGIGIARDKLPFVFNRFYQVDDSSTRNYGGTGIGLALAKEMAELMEGSLHAASEPGQGSVFILRLPLAKAAGTDVPGYTLIVKPAVPELSTTPSNDAETVTDKDTAPLVLIAEDNPHLIEFLAQAFRQSYRVLTAVDGTEAWQLAQQELPDVIISDWMMPGLDGYAFCRAVKGNLLTSHIAFIMLTAKAAPASRLQALQSGADDYLAKPFNAEELQLRAANLLERQRRLREKLCRELCKPGFADSRIHDKKDSPVEDPFILKTHLVIEEHLDEPAFGVEELAAGLYMSRAHLHRKVKAVADLTPTLLLRNYRLKRAAQFLKEGANSSEAAYKAGFDSAAYFSKCFREFYHTTPMEFIKQQF